MFSPHQIWTMSIWNSFPVLRIQRCVWKEKCEHLAQHQPYYTIDLVEGVQPPFTPICDLSQDEFVTLHEYFDENLDKRFIWHSKSLVGAPILFIKKKYGFLQMCVNYYGLHRLTIKNQYPLPLILGLLDWFNHAKVYTKINLHGAYSLVHIHMDFCEV